MFEAAELSHTIDKETYRKAVPALRAALLDAQYALKEQAKFPVVVLVGGQDGAGKGETINILYEWMDRRWCALCDCAGWRDRAAHEHPDVGRRQRI